MYSGGAGDGYSWTQTEDEIELRIPLAAAATLPEVRFTPHTLCVDLAPWLHLEEPLADIITVDECLWCVEKAEAELLITLTKARKGVWDRLFATDADAEAPSRRTDGLDKVANRDAATGAAQAVAQQLFQAAQADDIGAFDQSLRAMWANRSALPVGADDQSLARAVLEQCSDSNGRTALHFAANCGSERVIEYVLQKHPGLIDTRDTQGCTPLLLSMMRGKNGAALQLLRASADPSARSTDGTTALHHASRAGSLSLINLLLSHKVPVDARHCSLGTPLVWAARQSHPIAVRTLLAADANPNGADKSGATALVMAIGDRECSIALLAAKASVRATMDGGLTAMHVAASLGDADTLQLLVEADEAAVNMAAEDGSTPLALAREAGHMGAVSVLSELTTVKSTPAAPVVVSFVPFDALESRCVAMKGNFKFQRGELGLGYYLNGECAPVTKNEIQVSSEAAAEALQLKQAGNALVQASEHAAAELEFSKAIALDASQYTFYANRSLCRLKLQQPQAALDDAAKAKFLAPEQPKVRWRVGAALEALGRFDDAATEYYEGVKLDVKNQEMAKAFMKAVQNAKATTE